MKNKEYWHKRFIELENQNTKKTAKYYENLEKQFKNANKKIEADILVWYRRFAINNNVSLAEAKRILNSKELKELHWDVNEYIKYGKENAINQQWLKELENASARKHITRLEALQLQLQQQIEVLYDNQLDDYDKLARDLYKTNYFRTAYEIQKGFNIGYDLHSYNENQLEKALNQVWGADGGNFSSRIWKHKKELINSLNNEITLNIIKGKSPDDAINNIARKFNTSKFNAGRLVMTESSFISSLSQKDCYKDLDVEKYEIVATLDSHTSKICQDMDGEVFKLSDYESGTTAPPFHPYCRSCTCPYFPDNYGERIARDENGDVYYVPSDMKYKDWYSKFVEGERKTDLQKLSKDELVKLVKNAIFNKDFNKNKEILKTDIGFKKVDNSFVFVDEQLQEPVINQLKTLENRFNCIHNSNISIACETLDKGIGAIDTFMTNPYNQTLILNKSYYKNKKFLIESYKKDVNSGWFMPCKLTDDELQIMNINHEYGHILFNSLLKKRYEQLGWSRKNARKFIDESKKDRLQWYKDVIADFQKECVDEIITIAEKNNPDFDLLKNISGCGNLSDSEFLAEVFTNSQSSKPNELGLAMNEWLKLEGY